MKVTKSSGDVQEFSEKKIYSSVKEAGGSSKLAKEAIKEVKKNYTKNMPTKKILQILIEFLKKEPAVSEKYDLKRAIMDLGPSGFPFEKFFSKILKEYGFETKVGQKIKGKRIFHEVDVIAKKKKKFMIECKYHNHKGTITKLHPAMYTYARFLDLKKHNFDSSWLVTNTRCSPDALNYSKSVKQKVTSWKYPKKQSLEKLIERKKLYPITILHSIDENLKHKFFEKDLIILKDFEKISQEELKIEFNLTEEKAKEIIKDIYQILV